MLLSSKRRSANWTTLRGKHQSEWWTNQHHSVRELLCEIRLGASMWSLLRKTTIYILQRLPTTTIMWALGLSLSNFSASSQIFLHHHKCFCVITTFSASSQILRHLKFLHVVTISSSPKIFLRRHNCFCNFKHLSASSQRFCASSQNFLRHRNCCCVVTNCKVLIWRKFALAFLRVTRWSSSRYVMQWNNQFPK